jgi:nuclear pore complex protein Nup155
VSRPSFFPLTPDVFVDDIAHLLVICTSSRVSILGLSHPSPRVINLFATSLAISSPTPLVSIVSTDAGRIFALGLNHQIYEITYGASSAWFSSSSGVQASLVCRTQSSLNSLWPAGWSGSGANLSLAVDARRGRLFALTNEGRIRAWAVGGSVWEERGETEVIRSMQPQPQQQQLAGPSYGQPAQQQPATPAATVVHIAPVLEEASRTLWVMAVLSNGVSDV